MKNKELLVSVIDLITRDVETGGIISKQTLSVSHDERGEYVILDGNKYYFNKNGIVNTENPKKRILTWTPPFNRGIERIIKKYLETNLSIRTEKDIYIDNRYNISILLDGKEIDCDYIDL
jgi:hypothetical protein